jgi:hypothetical protein
VQPRCECLCAQGTDAELCCCALQTWYTTFGNHDIVRGLAAACRACMLLHASLLKACLCTCCRSSTAAWRPRLPTPPPTPSEMPGLRD